MTQITIPQLLIATSTPMCPNNSTLSDLFAAAAGFGHICNQRFVSSARPTIETHCFPFGRMADGIHTASDQPLPGNPKPQCPSALAKCSKGQYFH